ncbi:MAG: indole-3-glycerol phosphate synthase TrpC [Bacteroidales bacterium]|nr:indole-3-glycerol phosphate synthase TrpC [Bacteroidales bacterium]
MHCAQKNILDQIIAFKKAEVEQRKRLVSIRELEKSPHYGLPCLSMKQSLQSSPTGIIAEFKRKSPSKGWIHPDANPAEIVPAYEKAGASGASVLTDRHFFGGSEEDLKKIREMVKMPILRKDFIIEEYQLFEAKAMGADVILLIAACLTVKEVGILSRRAKELGMEVLLELHHEKELDYIHPCIDIAGVNNRDLQSFQVNLETSLKLAKRLPAEIIKISESGISCIDSVIQLREAGFRGFLMGENFMKNSDPGAACSKFIKELTMKTGKSC